VKMSRFSTSPSSRKSMRRSLSYSFNEDPGFCLQVIVGTSNPALGEDICELMGIKKCHATLSHFSDGECRLQVHPNLRGTDAYIIQPTCNNLETGKSVDDALIELLLLLHTLRMSNVGRVTAVSTYSKQQHSVALGAGV